MKQRATQSPASPERVSADDRTGGPNFEGIESELRPSQGQRLGLVAEKGGRPSWRHMLDNFR